MGNIGPLEIGVVLIIVLVVFGPKRLPELGRSVGKGMREFKNAVTGDDDKPDPPALNASGQTQSADSKRESDEASTRS